MSLELRQLEIINDLRARVAVAVGERGEAVALEREACARIVESYAAPGLPAWLSRQAAAGIAQAIRDRAESDADATVEIRTDDPLALTREEQAVLDAARDLAAFDSIRESWWPRPLRHISAERSLRDKLLARFRRAVESLPADPPEEP